MTLRHEALHQLLRVPPIGAAARRLFFLPPEELRLPLTGARKGTKMPREHPLKLLVWNIQYAAGRGSFFYDGGRQVSSPRERVEATLRDIGAAIAAEHPDLVLLQEVDRGARRTHDLDEHDELVHATGLSHHVSAAYHRARYVPIPRHEPLGHVDMHLSAMTRFRITGATRYQLPRLNEPVWRRLFNLRRALLDVRIPLAGGGELALLNTHLSAFSFGDGTLPAQIAFVKRHLHRLELQGTPWILAGDFNSLPPGFDRGELPPRARAYYPEDPSPIAPLFDAFRTPIAAEELVRRGAGAVGTYAPAEGVPADRTLDYVFAGAHVTLLEQRALHQHLSLSDHAPLVVRFQVERRA